MPSSHAVVRVPRMGSSGGLGLGCVQNTPAAGADVSLCLPVQCQKRLGGREGSLDQIAGQVNTCLFFLLYLSEVHVKKIPVEDS